ncbi:MAG TPA: PD-(D/E)XK nuclease family protein, partial [Thermoanaerobaculia bacterium]|nr:PD-(D/E)XK nuclease family protein [Thermoanaerobaculia bacterium]
PGAGRTTTVRFRADRLHREGERLVFVDFKTGRVPAGLDAKTEETRHEHLLAGVRSGQRLQAALYALSVAPRAADARYHFLAPDDDPPERSIGLAGDDETSAALRAGATTLLDALRLGLHPPRLLDAKLEQEYAGCEYCAVAEACVQRDSGFRLRLERWHAHEAARDGRRREREEALWKLWRLPAREEPER